MDKETFQNTTDLQDFLESLYTLTHYPLALKENKTHKTVFQVGEIHKPLSALQSVVTINGQPSYTLMGFPSQKNQQDQTKQALLVVSNLLSKWMDAKNTIADMAFAMRRSWRQVNALADMSLEQQLHLTLPQLCNSLAQKIASILNVEKVSLMLLEKDGFLRIKGAKGISDTVIQKTQIKPGEPIAEGKNSVFLSVPMILEDKEDQKEVIGVIEVTNHLHRRSFHSEDFKLLTTLASQVSLLVRHYQILDELRESERMQQEIKVASRIQAGLFPSKTLHQEGVSLAGSCVPAAHVGGDYYDYIVANPDCINFVLADISGHGVPSALFMTMVRSVFRTLAQGQSTPLAVATYLNQFLKSELPEDNSMFVTGVCGQYHPRSKTLSYVVGGHSPPWRLSKEGEVEILPRGGGAFGLLKEVFYEEQKVLLNSGDTLFLFTDGLPEARNQEGTNLGEEGLMLLIKNINWSLPEKGIETLWSEIGRFCDGAPQRDDQTILVLKVS